MTEPADPNRNIGPYGKMLGITSANVLPDDGGLELTMEVDERHHNVGGVVHGGILTGLLDSAMGGSVVITLAPDEWCATSSLTTDFMRPVVRGRLVARARVERRGRLTAFPRGEILDENGEIVARATGVWAIRKG